MPHNRHPLKLNTLIKMSLLVLCSTSTGLYTKFSYGFKALPNALTDQALRPSLIMETGVRQKAKDSHYHTKVGLNLHKVELKNALFSLSYEQFDLAWDQLNHPDLSGVAQPIDTLERWRGHLRLPYRIDNQRLWLAEIALANTIEQHAKTSLSYEGFILYSQARNLSKTDFDSWQLGLFIQQSPVETLVLPIIELTFNLNNPHKKGFYGHIGFPKTQLGYHFNPVWQSEFELIYYQTTAGLRDTNPLLPNGYAQLKSWRNEWKTTYALNASIDIHFSIKHTLTREWLRYDHTKKQTGRSDLENTLGYGIGIHWRL
ncbi:hypothetical protein JX580_09980 [Thiomicrospira microaerophila]|uniref:hypothetical protein n=1 Tax=Thiomicrospira microaerophila TaxID=406020 RepID=UPI00201080DF|nr:hypothetical protein [Thiomicrospira microaerophila]UQB41981.1 hypothetical protein JX580_09980 [Thiomicrospira microaerophila]